MEEYSIKIVYKKLSLEEKLEIVNLWTSENAVPYNVAIERVEHVVCSIIHNPTGKIIGVSTAPPKQFHGKFYYTYGMYISQYHRKNTFTRKQPWILQSTIDALKNSKPLVSSIILSLVENPKISHKLMLRKGWTIFDNDRFKNVYYIKLT